MSHEQSETVQDETTGRWVNVYGRKTPKAMQRLPDTPDYATAKEAVDAARLRSHQYGEELQRGRDAVARELMKRGKAP